MKTNFSRILFYLKPHLKKHKISFGLVFLGYAIGIAFDSIIKPYLYKDLIDTLSSGAETDFIFRSALHILVLIAITIVFHNIGYRGGDYANSYFQSKIMQELYDNTFKRFLRHSHHFFTSNFSGSMVAKAKRFTRSFEVLADVITYQVFFSFFTLLGIVVVLLFKAPILAYIFLGWSLLYIGMTVLFIRKKIPYDIREAAADSLVTGSLADAIMNIANIKIFGGNQREKNKFSEVTKDEEEKRRAAWYLGNLQNAIQALAMGILQIVVIFVALRLWRAGSLSLGMIVLLQIYIFNLFDILWNLGKALTKAVKSMTDMKEVIDIFDLPIDITDPLLPEPLKIKNGNIVFTDVSFIYKDGVAVFENFNLGMKPGERIGLVGPSGAGKSTITKLLLRFVDVTAGAIVIDGQDIRKITQDDLRSVISYVPQEAILFHRTIRENIAYGNPTATHAEIEEVARKAHAHEFILTLPKGYDTLVGERGVKLSGGERQRVAIARAMLKNSPILILDEATSSLDSVSESYIQDAFVELMKGRTTLVIAHRLSTIQKMDRIIVLEKGKILEEGSHADLLKKNGSLYKKLWDMQAGGFLAGSGSEAKSTDEEILEDDESEDPNSPFLSSRV